VPIKNNHYTVNITRLPGISDIKSNKKQLDYASSGFKNINPNECFNKLFYPYAKIKFFNLLYTIVTETNEIHDLRQ